jgi:alkylated DNA repair dioxygenase AlkB
MASPICSFFKNRATKRTVSQKINLLPRDGEVYFYKSFFTKKDADYFFKKLFLETPWRDDTITLFGKKVAQPRRTAWYADPNKSYKYSGLKMEPLPWTQTLLKIKSSVEQKTKCKFNSVLLNLYRHQKDSMGWHRDNEKELGPDPTIASVSFGETRAFQLRRYEQKDFKTAIDLCHGSLLLMGGSTQHHWEHCLPKKTQALGPRINLTFRQILQ